MKTSHTITVFGLLNGVRTGPRPVPVKPEPDRTPGGGRGARIRRAKERQAERALAAKDPAKDPLK